jgi:hypothetical protein
MLPALGRGGSRSAADTVWLQQAGGIADHQQDEQQERQADTHGKCPDRAIRGTLVPDQEEQATEQAPDDNQQEQDD